MSMNINDITIAGRMAKDPEVRATTSSKVANITLAVTRPIKNADGKYDADFIDCEVWGNSAEYLEKNAVKGQEVYVSGRLEIRNFTDKEGKKRSRAVVRAREVGVGMKPNGAAEPEAAAPAAPVEPDELPFA